MNKPADKQKPKISMLKAFWWLLPLVFRAAPWINCVCLALSMLHGAMWDVQAFFQQRFFDGAAHLAAGEVDLTAAIGVLLLYTLIQVLPQVLNGVGNYLPGRLEGIVTGRLASEIH